MVDGSFEADGRRIIARARRTRARTIARSSVVAAGIWARDVARMAGVQVPAGAVEHQYLITEKSNAIPAGLPDAARSRPHLLPEARARGAGDRRLGERHADLRRRRRALLVRPRAAAAQSRSGSSSSCCRAAERLPILNELGIRTVINGPIPISPDGEPIMGLAPERDNVYVACGFTSGIAPPAAPARRWRNGSSRASPASTCGPSTCAASAVIRMSAGHLPSAASTALAGATIRSTIPSRSWNRRAAGGARRSTRCSRPRTRCSARASAGSGPTGSRRPAPRRSTGRRSRAGPTGSVRSVTSAAAARERAVLIDQSSFSEYEISGPGALAALQRTGRQRPRQAAGRAGLHPALQRARRHRGRPHLRPPRREPLLHGDRQRLGVRATWAGSGSICRPTAQVTVRS